MTISDPVLILGATSMVGWHLYRHRQQSIPVCNPHQGHKRCRSWPRVALEDSAALARLIEEHEPQVVIHAGGICDVDRCEADPAWAQRINVDGTRAVLDALPAAVQFCYISSDHVFGHVVGPIGEDHPTAPVSAYGRSRVAAEQCVLEQRPDALLIRPGLPIGPSLTGRHGHLNWLQHRHAKGLVMTLVADEFRMPVWGGDLARAIFKEIAEGTQGIRHIAGQKLYSRVALAKALAAEMQLDIAWDIATRADQAVPHLGRIELTSQWSAGLLRFEPSDLQRYADSDSIA